MDAAPPSTRPLSTYIPIHGTHGAFPMRAGDWWNCDSEVSCYLLEHGLAPLRPAEPFVWSGDTNGAVRWPWSKRKHTDWQAGARAFRYYLREGADYVPISQRRVCAHSHALQLVLYACAEGLKLDRLLSITGPIRGDMAEIAKAARPNIGQWWHVYADNDRTQVFGALFDGSWGVQRQAVWEAGTSIVRADQQLKIPGVGHSGLLRDPQHFHWWVDAGLIPFLSERTPATDTSRGDR